MNWQRLSFKEIKKRLYFLDMYTAFKVKTKLNLNLKLCIAGSFLEGNREIQLEALVREQRLLKGRGLERQPLPLN